MTYLLANLSTIFIVVLALAVLALAWFVFGQHRQWNAVFGKRARDSQEGLGGFVERLMRAEQYLSTLKPRIDVLEKIGKVAIQKVGFLRFNPFDHTGGDQSFAAVFLDHDNNGVVISSLYTRDGVRVYAKEIKNGESKHSLSKEEKEVLEQAISNKIKS